ncbi:MAG TPA: 1,4-alpha-glucan branching protein domain-containing protein [Bryobacteraceae bacterium]
MPTSATKTPAGYLALVLHAHLPFVRHPEHEFSLEESWLFEAMTETYIRLFMVMERLLQDDIDFRLTLTLSPTLATMLLDPLLMERYRTRLDRSIELARKEVVRNEGDPRFEALARMYEQLFIDVRRAFVEDYHGNLVNAFKKFQTLGKIEVLACAATHGYLPLLAVNPSAVSTQVRVGVELYRQLFGSGPKGFWLPECAYYPGLDQILADNGIRYTLLETHGITQAGVRPKYGVYAPLECPSGVAVFGRDPDSSKQVWSSSEGYPGDFDYREFYRDIGFDLDLDYIRPYIHPDGIRIDTGLKYYRITGPNRQKELYFPEWAKAKADQHAEHYLEGRIAEINHLSKAMDRRPLILAPYDAELFGHWWWEGPIWIERLMRKAALRREAIQPVTPSEYLDKYPKNQVAQPAQSSWGQHGFNDVWLNHKNAWIYPHLHAAAETMDSLWSRPLDDPLTRRAAEQAARELLLAQSSDWAFMINAGAMVQYATNRTRTHLLRFRELARQVESSSVNAEWLEHLEKLDNIFPDIDLAPPPSPGSAVQSTPVRLASVQPRASLRIAMICPEIVPFAKTGGLADMVASLAKALDQLGHQIVLVMPAWRGLPDEAELAPGIPVHFIRQDRYFDRDHLYGPPGGEYPDNAERFAFFCRAALKRLAALGPFDIIHSHDWQTGLVNTFLKAQPERYQPLFSARTVFTVHNQAYQGLFQPSDWKFLGLDSRLFAPRYLEFYGKINFLKAGIGSADAVTTVSPTYAQEIKTPEFGCGLDGLLRERSGDLSGILNGVDYSIWIPATDPLIARTYTPDDLAGKQVCKADLQRSFKLALRPDAMLIGMVSRLASQKGFDLLEKILEPMLSRDVQFVLLGTGDPYYENFFRQSAERFRERARVTVGFNDKLAHRIEAGADVFLMPSLYEPSGLNQLYSLKYGTIPIVRATGGLKDSVQDFNYQGSRNGNGFVFESYEAGALLNAIDRALAAFQKKPHWSRLMRNAMACDYSWDRSAAAYVSLYRRLLLR